MRRKTIGLAAASLAAVGAIALGGASIASAADDSTASPSPSTSASASAGDHGRGSQDTAVTGSEADKVIAAVKAKDAAATIDTVRKDPDGSYDALGTKDGSPVFYDVSADLQTITANTHGPGGGRGGRGGPGGGSQDTAVTGTEADKVIAAVKAKDSTAIIDTVRKDPDGSYDALGTKDGTPVFYDVSADLKTVTANTHGPGGHGPDDSSDNGTTSSDPSDANAATTSASTTVTV
ncbi:hypothetical protein [Arthrobacter sp. NEB 688]|uniref:hypothetical protein n=1 Tax=Arthrobacter sp. NEB 688 TaxID=904039 RepID=UPI0015649BB7|nr:hypothetical protein [Arthrobacter sp. NEB 688]QKE85156.1 hypothetical protein HL663_15235 [Arthrobacter sp. NEB 688]